jgi:uncharacterized protein with FMN-binding domain
VRSSSPARRRRRESVVLATGTSRPGRRHRRDGRMPGTVLALIVTLGGSVMALRYHPGAIPDPDQERAAIATASIRRASASPGAAAHRSAGVTVLGRVVSTDYGDLQVQVTLTKGKITSARAVHVPDVGGKQGERINARALPILYAETTRAQSARIDAVSGATISSTGYKQSLQSAIDAAHRK